MSRYIQHIKPACKLCRKNYWYLYHTNQRRPEYLLWLDVSFARDAGDGMILKCNHCGHEWYTRSQASRLVFGAESRKERVTK
jgi:ribosomal protein L33